MDTYEDMERRQTERRILLPGPRGDVYDRNANLLIGNRPQYSATVILDDLRPEFRKEYSKQIKQAREQIEQAFAANKDKETKEAPLPDYNQLAWDARMLVIQKYVDIINSITGRNDQLKEIRSYAILMNNYYCPLPLAEDLSPEQYARLVERIPVDSPISFHTSTARFYPYNSLLAHTLGYVQNINPDLSLLPKDGLKNFTYKTKIGKTGIEKHFNDLLAGTDGFEIWQVDPLGFQNKRLNLIPPKQGDDLITSIDMHSKSSRNCTWR